MLPQPEYQADVSGSPLDPGGSDPDPPATEPDDRPDVVVPSAPTPTTPPGPRFGPTTHYQRRRRAQSVTERPSIPIGVPANPVRALQVQAVAALETWDGDTPNPWRRLWCRWYFRCLDFAATRGKQGWDQFTCRECDVRDELGDAEKARQSDAFMRLYTFHAKR